MDMADNMKIRCAVYGEDMAFPITIARNAEISDLQKAIALIVSAPPKPVIHPRLVTLYLAKKGDAWLKEDEYLAGFLHGPVDKTYKKMVSSSWNLDDVQVFGSDFQPVKNDIHILVELPEAVVPPAAAPSLTSTRVEMNSYAAAEESLKAYMEAAERLKDDRAVSQLVAAVHYVAEDTQARPFIVLESSSGMGKTQMAFNLMARDAVEMHYVVCEGGGNSAFRQTVYTAFDTRAVTFLECINKDSERKSIGKGEFTLDTKDLSLHTFEFIRALLSGADKMESDECAYQDVRDLLTTIPKEKPVVFFLDEFPSLDTDLTNEVKLRFMRNVFRTLQIPVILSSTNGTARSMVTTGTNDSRGATAVRWCVMVPEMPRFKDPATAGHLRPDFVKIVEHSRPYFARLALDYMRDNVPPSIDNGPETIKYMDNVTQHMAEKCLDSKRFWADWFREGQVCLFLNSSFYESTETSSRLIHGHFAKLQDPEMFELRFAGVKNFVKWNLTLSDGKMVSTEPSKRDPWVVDTVFPALEQDVLLYMSLMGGKEFRPFIDIDRERVSFCEAFRAVDFRPLSTKNRKQKSNDGMRLEASTVAAIVSASHCYGFAGIPLDAFLREMVYELEMGRPESAQDMCKLIPPALRSRLVPFLAPPDTEWPDGLPSALKLGVIARTMNEERMDFKITRGWVTGEHDGRFTGECKDYGKPLDLPTMTKILERVPGDSDVHVVVTNQLQERYFTKKPFEEYLAELKEKKNVDLTDRLFLQCGIDGVVRDIRSMKNNVVGVENAVASADGHVDAATSVDRVEDGAIPAAAAEASASEAEAAAAARPKRLVLFLTRGVQGLKPSAVSGAVDHTTMATSAAQSVATTPDEVRGHVDKKLRMSEVGDSLQM